MIDALIGGKCGVWKNMREILTIRREEFDGCCYAPLTALKKEQKAKCD